MELTFLIARLVVALVFGIAGAAKLSAPGRTRDSLREFRVPERLVALVSVAVPVAELCVAGLLIPMSTAVGAAVAAAVMLLVFSAAIGFALARGEQPECNCFGRIHSRPVGRSELARNVLLTAVAAGVAGAGPGESLGNAFPGGHPLWVAAGLAISVVVVVQIWFGYQLLRQHGRLIERVRVLEEAARPSQRHGLPVGQPAPAFALPDLDGRPRTLAELLTPGVPLALAFSDPDCGACRPMLDRFAQLRADHPDELAVALVTRGSEADTRATLNGHVFDAVLFQERRELAEAFEVSGVPSAVVIGPDGRIESSVAFGEAAIVELFNSSARPSVHASEGVG